MKLIKKLSAGFFLTLGFAFLLVLLSGIVEKNNHPDRRSKIWGGLLFGIPNTVTGLWLINNLAEQNRLRKEEYIRFHFFNLIKNKQGKVSILDLAMAAHITGKEAENYLEQYAREFNGNFKITPDNNVIYLFDSGK